MKARITAILIVTILLYPKPAPVEWSEELLHALGNTNPSAETVAFVEAWVRAENTRAEHNPLATTQPMPGDTCFNYLSGKCGVRNYTSRSQGLDATVKTLQNGLYPNIVTGLLTNNPRLAHNQNELDTWGTGLFLPASVIDTALSKLGAPYVYGARGPDMFDCSGFVQWVWAQHGVAIPPTTFTQLPALRVITREELQPGDLIYQQFPTDQHVVMWAGDLDGNGTGDVINAGGYTFSGDVNIIYSFFEDNPVFTDAIIGYRRVQ